MSEYSDNLTVADVEAVLRALPDHAITGDEMCPCQNRRPAPDAVARLVEAVENERNHKSAYDATPADRGGHKGPKGQAYVLWCEARADVGTALAAMEASHDRA